MRLSSLAAPLALVLALALISCGGDEAAPAGSQGATQDGDSVALTVTREGDEFTPNGERVELAVDQTVRGLSMLSVTALSAAATGPAVRRGRQSSSWPSVERSGEVSRSTWPMSTVSRPSTRILWLFVSRAIRPSARPSTK